MLDGSGSMGPFCGSHDAPRDRGGASEDAVDCGDRVGGSSGGGGVVMKVARVVEACETRGEMVEMVWALAGAMGPVAMVKIVGDAAGEMLKVEELKKFVGVLREIADGLERWMDEKCHVE